MNYKSIPTEDSARHFGAGLVELQSESLGGHIVSVSDEWFASASCLLRDHPAKSLSGQFGPNGALYDGWESRRHCATYDWVIIRLGAPSGTIVGFDIDTSHFIGNYSPEAAVYGLHQASSNPAPEENDPRWQPLLPVVKLGPSSRHLFSIPTTKQAYTHVKLHMIPDGGIARFRVYGDVVPIFPKDPLESFDLASVLMGGKVVFSSNQHFDSASNLILPGRGPASMAGGWETARSRIPGYSDHVIVQLGVKGYLDYVEIDTNYYIGNYPHKVDLFATHSEEAIPSKGTEWIEILSPSKLGPHRQQYFQLTRLDTPFTHVRMTIYPDGGVKRLRLMGSQSRSTTVVQAIPQLLEGPHSEPISKSSQQEEEEDHKDVQRISVVPLTPEAFSPFGHVIQSYSDLRSCPKEIIVKRVNFDSSNKFNHLAPLTFQTPPQLSEPGSEKVKEGEINFCVFRSEPTQPSKVLKSKKKEWSIKALERHQFSSQAFIPMGKGGSQYLVVVALPSKDGQPDLKTMKAFLATSQQGISYLPNIWHHPLLTLETTTDFSCLVYETGNSSIDCEIKTWSNSIAILESDF